MMRLGSRFLIGQAEEFPLQSWELSRDGVSIFNEAQTMDICSSYRHHHDDRAGIQNILQCSAGCCQSLSGRLAVGRHDLYGMRVFISENDDNNDGHYQPFFLFFH